MSILKFNAKIIILFLLLNFIGDAYANSLSDKIYVESRLPAYLNTQKAFLVFERLNVEEEISIKLTFCENQTQQVPAAPLKVLLSGPNARHDETIDISSWPDGEYKVTISESKDTEVLVRAIRKQTIKNPCLTQKLIFGQKP
jgi:hypothetical protein